MRKAIDGLTMEAFDARSCSGVSWKQQADVLKQALQSVMKQVVSKGHHAALVTFIRKLEEMKDSSNSVLRVMGSKIFNMWQLEVARAAEASESQSNDTSSAGVMGSDSE